MHYRQIIQDIKHANLSRSPECIRRRFLKILEELGETSEAYLSRTSKSNYKNKSWEDYREESIDTMIVLVDVALTEFEGVIFPPDAFLPNHLKDAANEPLSDLALLEDRKFDIIRAVSSAEDCLRSENIMGFYGAMARGIRAAADMCYAKVEKDIASIDEEVYRIVSIKLDKWRNQSANQSDPCTPRMKYTVVESDEIDAKTYFDNLRDRNS